MKKKRPPKGKLPHDDGGNQSLEKFAIKKTEIKLVKKKQET